MTDRPPLDQERAILAAEYVLDLLDTGQRADALRLLKVDAEFAAEVARWERQFEEWLEDAPDELPSAELWERIVSGVGRGHIQAVAGRQMPRSSRRWQFAALAASVFAVGFASLWLAELNSQSENRSDETVAAATSAPLNGLNFASIHGAGDEQLVAAIYDRATGRFVARLSPLDTRGRVPELWLIGSDGKPKSLGIAETGGSISITLPPELRHLFADGATIAISLETPSTTPHSAPSGPILGSAKISGI